MPPRSRRSSSPDPAQPSLLGDDPVVITEPEDERVEPTAPSRVRTPQFAEAIGVSVRAARYMEREEGAPFEYHAGGWLMPAALHWYIRREKKRGRPAAPVDLNAARLRQESANAELAELKLAELRKELMTVADFDRVVSDAFMRVNARLDTIPVRLAGACLGFKTQAEAMVVIERMIDEARAELYASTDIDEEPPAEDPEDDEPEDEAP